MRQLCIDLLKDFVVDRQPLNDQLGSPGETRVESGRQWRAPGAVQGKSPQRVSPALIIQHRYCAQYRYTRGRFVQAPHPQTIRRPAKIHQPVIDAVVAQGQVHLHDILQRQAQCRCQRDEIQGQGKCFSVIGSLGKWRRQIKGNTLQVTADSQARMKHTVADRGVTVNRQLHVRTIG